MTTDKMLSNVCEMLRNYDVDSGNTLAEEVITAPEVYAGKSFGFYSSAAELIIDLRSKLDSKASSRTLISAARRIAKGSRRADMKGVFQDADRYCVCDGYRLVRLENDITSLPHVENDFNTEKAMPDLTDAVEVTLPSIGDLRGYIATKGLTPKKPGGYDVHEGRWFNPFYLIDMLQIFPDCKCLLPLWRWAPLHFTSEKVGGDGILLPVRPPVSAA